MQNNKAKIGKYPGKINEVKIVKNDINNNEDYKKLKEDKKKLKKELQMKESEINNLKKLLDNEEKDIKLNYIPLKEARKITYKALRKGSATQKLINLIESTSINYKLKKNAIKQLMTNAFGIINYQKNHFPEILKYKDSHLKLFRQEQLILLAENERLTLQMKELKKQLLDNKIENLKKDEKKFLTPMRKNTRDITKRNSEDDSFVELDADIVEKNLINLIKNIKASQLKLLYYAFRKISNNAYYNSDRRNISASLISSLKEGVNMLNNILKNKKNIITCNIFYKLLNFNVNNLLYNSKYLNKINEYNDNKYLNERKNQGISPFVYKPYYYDNLPSASYDLRKKKYQNFKDEKCLTMKNLIHSDNSLHDYYLNRNTKSNINMNKFYKNEYFDFNIKKKNAGSEKYYSFNDLDFEYFSSFDKDKFMDILGIERAKK